MPTKEELEERNVRLEMELKAARNGGNNVDELKRRLAVLEGAANVDLTPPRLPRPDEERARMYGGALLKSALEAYPDTENYPNGSRLLSTMEQENIELKSQLAEQKNVNRLRERLEENEIPTVVIGDEGGE